MGLRDDQGEPVECVMDDPNDQVHVAFRGIGDNTTKV